MTDDQGELPLMCALSSPSAVPADVVAGFATTAQAVKWAFENRTNPGGKPVSWIAKNLGVQRQRLSRILNHGDFKLDAGKVPLWDYLVGNTAVSQYVALQRDRIVKRRAELLEAFLMERAAA